MTIIYLCLFLAGKNHLGKVSECKKLFNFFQKSTFISHLCVKVRFGINKKKNEIYILR